MTYEGKLYGKIGELTFPLLGTSKDFDNGQEAIELLKKIDRFIDTPTNSVGFNSQFQIEIKQLLTKIETFNLNSDNQ